MISSPSVVYFKDPPADHYCSRRTVESFGEEEDADAEEDEEVDDLLAMVFDVVMKILKKKSSSCERCNAWLRCSSERMSLRSAARRSLLPIMPRQQQPVNTISLNGHSRASLPCQTWYEL